MVECLIPFSGGCEFRERALEFVAGRLDRVTVSAINGPWVKGRAVNPAVASSRADVVVVADADCVTDGLSAAIEAVESGAAWAIPHRKVVRLTEVGTDEFMRTGEYCHPFDRRPYTGMPGGGIVVARRDTLLSVPLDPRFRGWGQEDESWALALTTLAGVPWRGNADLIHLWHPPQRKQTLRKGSSRSWDLYLRYRRAAGDRKAMRALLKEAS